MKRFYTLFVQLLFTACMFGQGFNFTNTSFAPDISNNCLNGGSAVIRSVQVSGLATLSNDLELKFAGADMTIKSGFDLKITIISPQGTRAVFFDTKAGSNPSVQLDKYNLFRTRSCDWYPAHTSPQMIPWPTGPIFCLRPITDFSIFKGENPNGEWKFEFCSTSASNLSLGFLMLEFRTLKTIITPPNIIKKPTDCVSADGTIEFDVSTKCDQGIVLYSIDNKPWQSKLIPVDYSLGFVSRITNSITGLTSGRHVLKSVLADHNGFIYSNTYNERVFHLDAISTTGDIQVVCAGDYTIGNGTTGTVEVKLIPPLHWDNCGFPTSITKITGKFSSGDYNVDLSTQSVYITGNGITEFEWEITNSKGEKKICSSFVTTMAGNSKVFTADVCKSPIKAPKCDYTKPLQYIPITISQLQNLGNVNNLDKVEVKLNFAGRCSGEAYLIDPSGNSYLLFSSNSFPSYFNSGSITVEFTSSTDPSIRLHNSTVLPTGNDRLRKPISNLNFANIRKINPNGVWNLAVCDNNVSGFTVECFKLHFNDACSKDQEAPRFTNCPSNQILILDANNQQSFKVVHPLVNDNCKIKSLSYNLQYFNGATDLGGVTNYQNLPYTPNTITDHGIKGKGRALFTFIATDDANNVSYCQVNVFSVGTNDCATDQVKPTLVNCVPDFEIFAYPNGLTDFYTTDPDFYDNCGIASQQLNVTYLNGAKSIKNTNSEIYNSISPNQTYTYQVVGTGSVHFDYYVTDLKGNVGSCKTIVTVKPSGSVSDPCASHNPTLSISGGNCTNNVMSINNTTNIVKIDWKNGNQTVNTALHNATPVTQGTTLIGTGVSGNTNSQIGLTQDIALDNAGNIYVCDTENNRVLKFASGSSTGTVIAGGNGAGPELNKLDEPIAIQVDNFGNVYIVDAENHRVTRWDVGATNGIVVAGGNGPGNLPNQLDLPYGLFVDNTGNVYVADHANSRIQKWATGAIEGITVAGGSYGTNANQLGSIRDIIVNNAGEIFVIEPESGHVKKFPANSTQGTNGTIVAKDKANAIRCMYMDAAGNIYISNIVDNYIKKFPPNGNDSTPGVIVAGGNGSGSGNNQLNGPRGFTVDNQGNIYIVDQLNYRIQKWQQIQGSINATFTPTVSGTYSAEVTRVDGCQKTTNSITITDCNSNSLLFNVGSGCITPGMSSKFPITVSNFNGIGAFQFDLSLPAFSNLKFDKIDNLGISNVQYNVLPNGDLRITWDEPSGVNINLANNTRIFDVYLSATSAFSQPITIIGKDVIILSNSGVTTGQVSTSYICVGSSNVVSGNIQNPLGKPIANVNVDEYNPFTQTWGNHASSNSTGDYTLGQVLPTNQIIAGRNDDPSNGVNIADVARIRRHILQTALLDTDYKKMAADVDKNGTLNVVDVAVTNRIVLKKIDKFPNNESWRLLPKGLNISANPLDVNIPWYIDLTSPGVSPTKADFIAIKVGDVDFSSSIDETDVQSRLAPVSLTIPDTIMAPSQEMIVPVYVSGGDNISIFSMNLNYDNTKIKLEKIESSLMQGFGTGNYNDLGGSVIIAWDHPQGGEFVGNGTLMKLTFSNIESTGIAPIEMADVNVYDVNFDQYATTLKNGSINMMTSSVRDLENEDVIKVYPNPFQDVLNLDIDLNKQSTIEIEITESSGKVINRFTSEKALVSHSIQIKDIDYKGIIFVTIKSEDSVYTYKVIKL